MISYMLEETEASVTIQGFVIEQNIHTSSNTLVSDADFEIFQWIVGTFLCQAIDIFGITTNIINIACFVSQGFKDPINASLTGLATSDLLSLITVLWSSICLTPLFRSADLPFDPAETQYLIGGIPHSTFSRISGWITALVTMERCLCITVPLKVKDMVTSRRVTVIIICVFVLHLLGVAPLYVVCRLDMKWSPDRNTTIYGLIFTENRETVEKVSFVVNGVFFSFSSFLIIIICTVILVFKLQANAKWRKMSTIQNNIDTQAKRNQKVAKMVVTISLLFIICFSPLCASFLAMTLVPGLSIEGKHRYLLLISGWIGVVLESINSSVNIFVYYYMSSKYKESFHKLFSLKKNK